MKALFHFSLAMAIMLSAASTAKAQSIVVAGNTGNGSIKVSVIRGKSYTVSGYLKDLAYDSSGPWVLSCSSYNMWGSYTVYHNQEIKKKYTTEDGGEFSSMAMRRKGDDIIIAGTIARRFNKKGFEAKMFGEVNFRRKFTTEYERKSLKRERFYGFVSADGTKTSVPKYDVGAKYTDSEVFHIFACDYEWGNIFTTGWGEREYTHNTGYTNYLVRRCARVWKNGELDWEQFQNRTSAAYSINVVEGDVLTSGHNRGQAWGWFQNKDIISMKKDAPISSEAVIKLTKYGDNFKHLCVSDGKLYSAEASRTETTLQPVSGLPGYKFYDVVAYPKDMVFYAVCHNPGENELEVWAIPAKGNTPTKVGATPLNGIETGPNAVIKIACK